MAKTFTTTVALKLYIEKACDKAVKITCNRLLGTLQQLILTEYYDVFTPARYSRSYQFFESATTKMLNSLVGEIYMDDQSMNYGAHWDGETQLYMASQGMHGSADIQTEGRFWNDFIDFCDSNAARILREELINQGLEIK